MVRLILLLAFFSLAPVIMYAQADSDVPASEDESSAEPVENAESVPAPTEDSENKASTPDEKIFAAIEGDLHRYVTDYSDSTVLQKKKKRQFTALAASINKRYVGTKLSFQKMCVSDVEPEQDLTPYGRQQAKRIIKKIKNDPQGRQIMALGEIEENPLLQLMVAASLATCKKCMHETGRYEVRFSLGEGCDSSHASVHKMVNSESEALRYKKRATYPVSGTVRAIKFEDVVNTVQTTILLK